MLYPVKGMKICQLQNERLLLYFNHIIDRNRALEGCPWTRCDLNVYVHDLPLTGDESGNHSTYRNRLGLFCDMEMDKHGYSLGSTMRIRVSIDVNLPVNRALKLRTMMGEEHLVSLTYERFSNFCYSCGCLEHIGKYCELLFPEGFVDSYEDTPYGLWLGLPF
ncbi:hypothetical protein Salat_1148600 [Sesamum alatum]|uniref:Zinc knuckle CX2CX4HX4C domain-containing protein n=1 Tax=Sesamum alatum TaxID=300844 RepID=A0AAE1YEA1_9LAMI|nr:hypothetical protein Salat_1148600 [Sesamum alatum]